MCAALTPPAAGGRRAAVNAGQTFSPARESVLRFGLSASNRYSERPCPSTRTWPTAVCRVVSWLAACEADEGVVAALPPLRATTRIIATNSATAMFELRRRRVVMVVSLSLYVASCGQNRLHSHAR